ncbi:MAG: hypothetical protein EDR02_03045 [Actinobacteria bacterium]|nr:MAG: hypothetical protein EDR02_03045 [Actinomycetota bacterium]RIK06302.1 MAG: hypothetical protein DCC48_07700 [Acidobacteriota bacterium]
MSGPSHSRAAWPLATSEWTGLQVVEDGDLVGEATAPIATVPALIALKAEAIPRRSGGNSPQKVGSDIHDLVCLGCERPEQRIGVDHLPRLRTAGDRGEGVGVEGA